MSADELGDLALTAELCCLKCRNNWYLVSGGLFDCRECGRAAEMSQCLCTACATRINACVKCCGDIHHIPKCGHCQGEISETFARKSVSANALKLLPKCSRCKKEPLCEICCWTRMDPGGKEIVLCPSCTSTREGSGALASRIQGFRSSARGGSSEEYQGQSDRSSTKNRCIIQ